MNQSSNEQSTHSNSPDDVSIKSEITEIDEDTFMGEPAIPQYNDFFEYEYNNRKMRFTIHQTILKSIGKILCDLHSKLPRLQDQAHILKYDDIENTFPQFLSGVKFTQARNLRRSNFVLQKTHIKTNADFERFKGYALTGIARYLQGCSPSYCSILTPDQQLIIHRLISECDDNKDICQVGQLVASDLLNGPNWRALSEIAEQCGVTNNVFDFSKIIIDKYITQKTNLLNSERYIADYNRLMIDRVIDGVQSAFIGGLQVTNFDWAKYSGLTAEEFFGKLRGYLQIPTSFQHYVSWTPKLVSIVARNRIAYNFSTVLDFYKHLKESVEEGGKCDGACDQFCTQQFHRWSSEQLNYQRLTIIVSLLTKFIVTKNNNGLIKIFEDIIMENDGSVSDEVYENTHNLALDLLISNDERITRPQNKYYLKKKSNFTESSNRKRKHTTCDLCHHEECQQGSGRCQIFCPICREKFEEVFGATRNVVKEPNPRISKKRRQLKRVKGKTRRPKRPNQSNKSSLPGNTRVKDEDTD